MEYNAQIMQCLIISSIIPLARVTFKYNTTEKNFKVKLINGEGYVIEGFINRSLQLVNCKFINRKLLTSHFFYFFGYKGGTRPDKKSKTNYTNRSTDISNF